MNRLKLFKTHIIISVLAAILTSCEKEQPIKLDGNDCSIVSFSIIPHDASPVEAEIYPDKIIAVFDYNFDFSNATVEFVLSEGANISPDPKDVDLSQENTFIVTSANGESTKKYSYSAQYDSKESYCKENIYLQSQSEVDQFGKNNYTRVFSIVINGTEDNPITDLSPLNSILFIDHNFTVKGFQGENIIMDNLKQVSSVDIIADTLNTISFGNVTTIDNVMIGILNEEQTSTSAITVSKIDFNKLKVVNNNFVVYLNTTEAFDNTGFDSLNKVYGETVLSLINQSDFGLFSQINEVNHFNISGGKMENLKGLENLKTINGILKLQFLNQLTETSGFSPETVGTIYISNCSKLKEINCFSNIKETTTVSISGVPSLKDISGLSGIKKINDGLFFRWAGVTNLDALSGLEYVGNTILFNYNSSLEDFSGLKQCLQNFNGTYDVKGNKKNPSIDEILG